MAWFSAFVLKEGFLLKLREVIEYASRIKPHTFDNDTLTVWINECEGHIQTEVIGIAPVDIISYSYDENAETELILTQPHSKLYGYYLAAMIDFAHGEYQNYENTMKMYNACLDEFAKWFIRTHSKDSGAVSGYYLSAYGLAVKHGYQGTEEEWLKSLVGPQGEQGVQGEQGPKGDSTRVIAGDNGYLIIDGEEVRIYDDGEMQTKFTGMINNLAEQFSNFWDCIQQNGERTDYSYAFCNTDYEEINPKYPITADKVMYMFMGCSKLKDASNIVIDITADKPNMMYVCANCNSMTKAPIFNFLNAPIIKTYTSMYTGCYSLSSVSVYWGDGSADAVTQRNACQNMFFKCWELTDVDFGAAETGSPTGLDLSYAKELTVASVQSLLSSLKTIPSGSAGKYEITLAAETAGKLTPEIMDGFTAKGWTIISKTREKESEE